MARVLLADSQPLFSEAIEALLARDTSHVVVARCSTPDELLGLARAHHPDLVLIEARIALTGRPNLVEVISSDQPELRTIVLADRLGIDLVVMAVRSGASGVLGKDAGAQTILRATDAVLGGEGVVPRAMLPEVFRRLADDRRGAQASPLDRLSPREQQVLNLLGKGWDNGRIGAELFITPNTVRTHIQNILEKLDMHSKLEAATFAMRRNGEGFDGS